MKKDCKEAPSDLFESCIRSAGSIVIDCELCGRTHFGTGGDFDEGEYESLCKKHEADPEKYIQHFADDMVSYGYIQGKQAVIGCPCNGLRRFEDWILKHKYLLLEYLTKHAEEKFEEAEGLRDASRIASEMFTKMREKESKPNGKVRKFDLE